MQGDSAVPRDSPTVRDLAELLARRLKLTTGRTRVELEFEDGRLVAVHLHERVSATGFARFDPTSP